MLRWCRTGVGRRAGLDWLPLVHCSAVRTGAWSLWGAYLLANKIAVSKKSPTQKAEYLRHSIWVPGLECELIPSCRYSGAAEFWSVSLHLCCLRSEAGPCMTQCQVVPQGKARAKLAGSNNSGKSHRAALWSQEGTRAHEFRLRVCLPAAFSFQPGQGDPRRPEHTVYRSQPGNAFPALSVTWRPRAVPEVPPLQLPHQAS